MIDSSTVFIRFTELMLLIVSTQELVSKSEIQLKSLGLHCLLRPICPNIKNIYGTIYCFS